MTAPLPQDLPIVAMPIPKGLFLVGMFIYALLDFLLLVKSVQAGNAWTAVTAFWLASVVPIALCRQFIEHGSVLEALSNWRLQSWAFLFGDSLWLPFAGVMLALYWRDWMPDNTWISSRWWFVVSAIVGLGAGYVFRYVLDRAVYLAAGAINSFSSPSKFIHEGDGYPVLFGGLVCIGLSVLVRGIMNVTDTVFPYLHPEWPSIYMVGALFGVIMWGVMAVIHDIGLFGPPLVPQILHPNNVVWPSWSEWWAAVNAWLNKPLW